MSPKTSNEIHQFGILARTLDERLDASGPHCSVRFVDGNWKIYLNEEPLDSTFATSRKALAAARHYNADMQRKIAEEFFKTSGLSPEAWTLNAHALVSNLDPAEFVVFYRRTYMAHIGCHALPPRKTIQDAVKLINATFHLPGPMLLALEQVYGAAGKPFGPGSVNWPLFAALRDKGFISFDDNDDSRPVFLTETGRAALTRDPRGLPLEMREIIFAAASTQEQEFRPVWNNLISSDIAGQLNAQGLRSALIKGFELHLEDNQEEGRDAILRGTGKEPDGTPVTNVMVASFTTQWEPSKIAAKRLAEIIVQHQSELRRQLPT